MKTTKNSFRCRVHRIPSSMVKTIIRPLNKLLFNQNNLFFLFLSAERDKKNCFLFFFLFSAFFLSHLMFCHFAPTHFFYRFTFTFLGSIFFFFLELTPPPLFVTHICVFVGAIIVGAVTREPKPYYSA